MISCFQSRSREGLKMHGSREFRISQRSLCHDESVRIYETRTRASRNSCCFEATSSPSKRPINFSLLNSGKTTPRSRTYRRAPPLWPRSFVSHPRLKTHPPSVSWFRSIGSSRWPASPLAYCFRGFDEISPRDANGSACTFFGGAPTVGHTELN